MKPYFSTVTMLAICAMLFVAGYVFDLSRLEKKLVVTELKQTDLKNQLKVSYYDQIFMEEKISRLPEVEQSLLAWEARFIKQADLTDLLKEIQHIGRVNHVRFDYFNSGQEQVGEHYSEVPVDLIVSGSYAQTIKFMTEVAELPWLVVVRDFAMTKTDETVSTELSLAIYYLHHA